MYDGTQQTGNPHQPSGLHATAMLRLRYARGLGYSGRIRQGNVNSSSSQKTVPEKLLYGTQNTNYMYLHLLSVALSGATHHWRTSRLPINKRHRKHSKGSQRFT
eukprot:1136771-Pelagomonas_calceolata.AAC.1